MQFEFTLIGQVYDHITLYMPTRYVPIPEKEPRARPLVLCINHYKGKGIESPFLDHRGGMAISSSKFRIEQLRARPDISKLGCRVREQALTCSTSKDEAFATWDLLKQKISRVYDQPHQAYRVRSRFYLPTRAGKNYQTMSRS